MASQGESASEIEEDLDITPGLLYQWHKAVKKKAAAEANGCAAEAAEIKRLKKELALVQQVAETLKAQGVLPFAA